MLIWYVPSERAFYFSQKGTYAEYLRGIKPSVKPDLSTEQIVSCYRCCVALCPPLQTLLLKKVPTAQCLCKLSHRKCEWGLFGHMQRYLKWHKNLLFHKTDHSIKKKKKNSEKKKFKNAVSLHKLWFAWVHEKRFLSCKWSKKKNYEDIIKKKVLFELYK